MLFLRIGLVLCLATLLGWVQAQLPTTIMCYTCADTTNPHDCTSIHKCHRGEHTCFSAVTVLNGVRHLSKGCMHDPDCHNIRYDPLLSIIGKRNGHEHLHGTILCQDCCASSIGCNKHTCDQALAVPATTTTTTTPPAPLGPCHDNEGDGFLCSDFDSLNFCTDTSDLAHKFAHERCPDHCGFCDGTGNFKPEYTTPAPTTIAPCVDHEFDGFLCADYDVYNFCTDTSSIAHKLAIDRCPKHCGFCNSGGNVDIHVVIDAGSTQGPTTAQATQSTTAASVQTTTSQTAVLCFDDEDAQFSCAQWASYGFCLNVGGTGHDIAVARCSKYCGFCS